MTRSSRVSAARSGSSGRANGWLRRRVGNAQQRAHVGEQAQRVPIGEGASNISEQVWLGRGVLPSPGSTPGRAAALLCRRRRFVLDMGATLLRPMRLRRTLRACR